MADVNTPDNNINDNVPDSAGVTGVNGMDEIELPKLAVFFPGIGYTCDRPLLHYTKKVAASLGFEVRDVPYTGFSPDIKGDEKKLEEAFKYALSQAEMLLLDIPWRKYGEIVFVSKSIGTIVAEAYALKKRLSTKNIYFTPVKGTMEFGIERGLVFHGTQDPYIDTEAVRKGCDKPELGLHIIDGANHSLETGDVFRDLELISGVMWRVSEYIG